MAVPTIFDTWKNMQFHIMLFREIQEIIFQSNMQGSKCDDYCIFYENFVSFSF